MAYFNDTTARNLGVTVRANTFVADIIAKIRARRMYRETFNSLSALTNRELADLGLGRSDLRRVAWEAAHEAN